MNLLSRFNLKILKITKLNNLEKIKILSCCIGFPFHTLELISKNLKWFALNGLKIEEYGKLNPAIIEYQIGFEKLKKNTKLHQNRHPTSKSIFRKGFYFYLNLQ